MTILRHGHEPVCLDILGLHDLLPGTSQSFHSPKCHPARTPLQSQHSEAKEGSCGYQECHRGQ
jgi:hypothetical protein